MSGLWSRYNKLLEAQPLLTKALTSLTGFTLGDVLAQNFVEDADKPYDVMRTVRLGSFGCLIHGTTGHYFYGMLDGKLPGTAPITVATKVAVRTNESVRLFFYSSESLLTTRFLP